MVLVWLLCDACTFVHRMAAMLKTSGYFSTSESARREVGMVQQVGKEITFVNLLISEEIVSLPTCYTKIIIWKSQGVSQ